MIIFDEKISKSAISAWDCLAAQYGRDKVAMFDLETTGLTPRSSFIYIIGINLYRDGEWHILQLFNDDGRSEPEMIRYFMELLEDKEVLFHFNGDTFDIPFVRGRIEKIKLQTGETISDTMSGLRSVDLYKEIRPYKYALGLPNVRQKTVELYLGLNREDQYNGGQLIDVYLSFLSSGSQRARDLVLLHNRDDMDGMFHLAELHALTMLCCGSYDIKDISINEKGGILELCIKLELASPLPKELFVSLSGTALHGEGSKAFLSLKICDGIWINKVTRDSEQGFFIPQQDYTGLPVYEKPEDKKCTAISAGDSLLGDPDRLKAYSLCCIRKLLKQKTK